MMPQACGKFVCKKNCSATSNLLVDLLLEEIILCIYPPAATFIIASFCFFILAAAKQNYIIVVDTVMRFTNFFVAEGLEGLITN